MAGEGYIVAGLGVATAPTFFFTAVESATVQYSLDGKNQVASGLGLEHETLSTHRPHIGAKP